MRTVIPYLQTQWRALAATFFVATLARLLLLADPQILRIMVDRYVLRADTMPREVFFRGVILLIGATVGVAMLARTTRIIQEYSIALVARRVGAKLYVSSIARSLLLPYSAFENIRSGQLLHTIQHARDQAENAISGAVKLYLGGVAIVAVTIYAFTVHPLLGFLHLVGLPLLGLLMLAISTPIRRQQARITRDAAALAGSTTETIRNLELVKSLGVETQQIGRLELANDAILGLEERKLRLIRRYTFLEGVLYHGMRATMLAAMLWLLYNRSITTGQFLTLFLYSSAIFTPLAEAGEAIARYQEARASFDTLKGALGVKEDSRRSNVRGVGSIKEVTFENVSLQYDAGREALKDISLQLEPGNTIAFAGPSGAGKSSIVKLLVGLYVPTSGMLRINGDDLATLDLDSYRARVGLVTQETQLFAGTVRENLQIARPDATDAECAAAIGYAAATPILQRGGEGLDTRIGEGGIKLSGGERQRIAIARALLRNPDLLVFDEATSNLDSISEADITQTIRAISAAHARRITVLVAHRLSTIAHADRIYVLSDGAIAESGTHSELLDLGGTYARLWREQSGARNDAGVVLA